MDFELLIVGMDANAYYMARCYHEKYNKKAYLIGKNPIWFTDLSNIVITKYIDNLWDEEVFLSELEYFYNEHKDSKILLVSSTENYIRLISKNKDIKTALLTATKAAAISVTRKGAIPSIPTIKVVEEFKD